MDDELSKKLNSFLNSPDGMEKLQGAMAALGISPDVLQGGGAETAAAPPPEPAPTMPSLPNLGGDISGLLQLAPLLSNIGKDDHHTALLKALRPYLHGDREKRLDDSMKMMQLLKLLPILQQKGGGGQ